MVGVDDTPDLAIGAAAHLSVLEVLHGADVAPVSIFLDKAVAAGIDDDRALNRRGLVDVLVLVAASLAHAAEVEGVQHDAGLAEGQVGPYFQTHANAIAGVVGARTYPYRGPVYLALIQAPVLLRVQGAGHLHVVANGAGGQNDALGRLEEIVVSGLHAYDFLAFSDEVHRLGIGLDGDVLVGVGLLLQAAEMRRRGIGVLAVDARREGVVVPMGARVELVGVGVDRRHDIHRGVHTAAIVHEPLDGSSALHAHLADHVLVAEALGVGDLFLGELLARVIGAALELSLLGSAGAEDHAVRQRGVAAAGARFLQDDHACTCLGGFDGGAEAGPAAADYDDIVLVSPIHIAGAGARKFRGARLGLRRTASKTGHYRGARANASQFQKIPSLHAFSSLSICVP